jgi:Tfp pilus assembly protein PilP
MIQLSKIVLIFCLTGALTVQPGCSSPEAPIVKPEIVRKKITVNTVESVNTGPASVAVPGIPASPPVKPENVPKTINDKPDGIKPAPDSGSEGSLSAVASPKQLPGGGAPKDAMPNKPSLESQKPLPGPVAPISTVVGGYVPEGKIDPFVPLLKDDPFKVLPDAKKREPTTPLERVDLSQLKLTAIIRTPSGYKAMVEETTGKGYIITVGTYVGIHSGKVTNIMKDRIIVEEEVEDALGNVANRNSELKFQKPSGEL